MKSINQFYNKRLAELNEIYSRHKIHTGKSLRKLNFKRSMKIADYMHKASRRIVDWCIIHDVKNLYIGHNDGWKQNCDMSKSANQNFVQIPFNMLISQLKYKLEEVGISCSMVNEAYSSKCSALDNESVGKHDEYCGKRIKRGLFRSKAGMLVNADVNGSLNILKIGSRNDQIDTPRSVFNPIKLEDINEIREVAYFRWQPADRGSVLEPNDLDLGCESPV